MATTQQVIDAKYEIVKAQQFEQLSQIFSPEILSYAARLNLFTYSEIAAMTSINSGDVGFNGIEQKGLRHLKELTTYQTYNNKMTGIIDFSGNRKLKNIHIGGCNFTGIKGLGYLEDLETLYMEGNSVSESFNLKNCPKLKLLRVYSMGATSFGSSLSTLLDLSGSIEMKNNALNYNTVNTYLRDFMTIATHQIANGGLLITNIDLSGTDMGTPNGDGITAKNELIALGITVTTN